MFEALDPKDVNLIATEVVQTLQGEGPRLAHLMEQTSQLTAHLADRDEVISQVIENVTTVMQATSEHREELRSVIGGLDGLVGDLADDSGDIDSAVVALDRMTASLDGLLDETSGPLSVALDRFAELGKTLVPNNDVLATTLKTPRACSKDSTVRSATDHGSTRMSAPSTSAPPHQDPRHSRGRTFKALSMTATARKSLIVGVAVAPRPLGGRALKANDPLPGRVRPCFRHQDRRRGTRCRHRVRIGHRGQAR